MSYLCILFVSICLSPVLSTGSIYYHQMDLLNYLLDSKRYNKDLIPVNSSSDDPIPIDLQIAFGDYVEVYEETQSVKVDLWLSFSWMDQLLSWNLSDYGGMSSIKVKLEYIWHPEIKINFGTGDTHVEDSYVHALVKDEGFVDAIIITDTTFRCSLSIEKFPFDEQNCILYIVPLNMFTYEAVFRNVSTSVKVIGDGQWTILSHGVAAMDRSRFSILNVSIHIVRRPSYYVIYIMFPIIVTTLLNPTVFLIPCGERASTAVTILLTYTVFLSVISDALPKTSTSISVLSIYIAISIMLSGVYFVACILIERYYENLDVGCCSVLCRANAIDDENKHKIIPRGRFDRMCAGICLGFVLVLTAALLIFLLT